MSQFKNSQRAAALKYESDKPGSAPVVVAAGAGYTAQKIIEAAEQNHIPVYRDDSLATLLSQLEVGTEIPPELYKAIVDIYVYFLGFVPDSQEISSKGNLLETAEPEL